MNPAQSLSSYIQTTFTVEDGLPSNAINALTQTENGFLWIGTNAGLTRFDGNHFVAIDVRGVGGDQRSAVRALASVKSGDLWIGTNSGLARLPANRQDQFDASVDVICRTGNWESDRVTNLFVSRSGVLWVGTESGLFRLESTSLRPVISKLGVTQISEALNGNLLIVASNSFYEWNGKDLLKHTELAKELGPNLDTVFNVLQDHTGTTWFCTNLGIAKRIAGKVEHIPPYGITGVDIALHAYEDPQGVVWAYKSLGLTRPADASGEVLGLDAAARAIYAAREGELWIGTNGSGLLRLKDRSVQMFTTADGLPSTVAMAVLTARNGVLWTGFNCGGLTSFDGKQFTRYYEKQGLSNSCVWSLAEGMQGDLWIGTWGGGAYQFKDGRFTQFSKPQGFISDIVRTILAARDGSVWFGTEAGLVRRKDGRDRVYRRADGLSSDHIRALYEESAGRILVGTATGIDVLENGSIRRLQVSPVIFDPQYISFGEGRPGTVYAVSAPRGVSRIAGDRVTPITAEPDLLGMVTDGFDRVWFSATNGIYSIREFGLDRRNPEDRPFDFAKLGLEDGLLSSQCSVGVPNLALDGEGNLWAATVKGLARVDLSRQIYDRNPPAIFLEEVTIEQQKQHVLETIDIAPGRHHVELKFDAIELQSPEKIRFQYRMDGVDSEWLDADTTRTAVYTSVPLGLHSFHIRACNRFGIWTDEAAVFNIHQQPFLSETTWFRGFSAFFLLTLLVGAFVVRQRQIAARHQHDLEERLDERERIARELHDTFLQGVNGLILRFQGAMERIPPEEPARKLMESALDRADEVLAEGRDRVVTLRSQTSSGSDLAKVIAAFGQELLNGKQVRFEVTEIGNRRLLHPVVFDEAYWIAREALMNASVHSDTAQIEVEISYLPSSFRVSIRDEGRGIAPEILEAGGRDAHFGLQGIEERSRTVGGILQIRSKLGAGAEIELTIPAAIAYRDHAQDSPWQKLLGRFPWRRLSGRKS